MIKLREEKETTISMFELLDLLKLVQQSHIEIVLGSNAYKSGTLQIDAKEWNEMLRLARLGLLVNEYKTEEWNEIVRLAGLGLLVGESKNEK